jgi:flagellar hook-associated protein 3 FlgL
MKVNKPSDDPSAYVQGQKESVRGSRAERHERTANVALMALQVADTALTQVTESLQIVRENAMAAATDTVSAEDRENIGKVVNAMREQILAFANSEVQGRHIFSGYLEDQVPFEADGSYHGHAEARQVEVANGVKLPVGLAGNQVFGADGGQDIFAALDDLQTALENNDVTAIRSSLDTLSQAQEQIVTARSEIGAHLDSFQVAASVAEEALMNATENRAQAVEADTFDAVSELARAQQALETAVSVAAQLPVPGLVSR